MTTSQLVAQHVQRPGLVERRLGVDDARALPFLAQQPGEILHRGVVAARLGAAHDDHLQPLPLVGAHLLLPGRHLPMQPVQLELGGVRGAGGEERPPARAEGAQALLAGPAAAQDAVGEGNALADDALVAVELEKNFSKQQIITLYLNLVNLGHGNYGIEAASRYYFGKPAKALNLAEAATLIGIIPAPSRYSPYHEPDLVLRQRNREVRFGDGVHRGGDDGNIECDLPGQKRASVCVRGDHFAASRLEKDVIESKALREVVLDHRDLFMIAWSGLARPVYTLGANSG